MNEEARQWKNAAIIWMILFFVMVILYLIFVYGSMTTYPSGDLTLKKSTIDDIAENLDPEFKICRLSDDKCIEFRRLE